MQPRDVTIENFATIITTPTSRSELLAAMHSESGHDLPLSNRVSEVARQFKTDPGQLARIVETELESGRDDLIRGIVFHPEIDNATLTRIYDSGLCTVELAHRAGPPELLERIADEHRIEEAVLTLLLDYYSTDEYSDSQFIDFIRRFGDLHGVRYELENKTNVPAPKRALGRRVLADENL